MNPWSQMVKVAATNGNELALHWWRGPSRYYERVGFLP